MQFSVSPPTIDHPFQASTLTGQELVWASETQALVSYACRTLAHSRLDGGISKTDDCQTDVVADPYGAPMSRGDNIYRDMPCCLVLVSCAHFLFTPFGRIFHKTWCHSFL